jgi:biotin carboxyl carrier protein
MLLQVQLGEQQAIQLNFSDHCSNNHWQTVTVQDQRLEFAVVRELDIVKLKRENSTLEQIFRFSSLVDDGLDISQNSNLSVSSSCDHGSQQPWNLRIRLDAPGQSSRMSQHANRPAQMKSPITGKVLRVLVKNNQKVHSGDVVAIIEAMKMENKIFAPISGIISNLNIGTGDSVETHQQLLSINP